MFRLTKIFKNLKKTFKKSSACYNTSFYNKVKKNEFKDLIALDLKENEHYLRSSFKSSSDVVFSRLEVYQGVKALIVYIDGLVNMDVLNRDIFNPLLTKAGEIKIKEIYNSPWKIRSLVSVSDVSETKKFSDIIEEILNGNSVMFIDGIDCALIINSKGYDKRSIEKPENESVIRGPKESFVENLRTNTSLLRRKIRNKNLVFENFQIGKQTKTQVAIAYIDLIANHEIIEEVRRRLHKIDTDSILDVGYIEQFIEDRPALLFPTVGNTEKPDVVAGKLLEGRVGIFCDGSPHALTMPCLLIEHFQTSEDYYLRPILVTLLRIMRIISFFITVLLPPIYIALQTYHQEMIPTVLLVKMASAMRGIPFPAVAETLLMTFLFEVLRESGTRLPNVIGSAISIVGALVIGQAAVEAGIVSSTIVIVIAATAISSFMTPSLTEPIIILRIVFIMLAGAMGLFGITCGLFAVLIHIVSLRSFGVIYTLPMAPLNITEMKDTAIRFPLHMMKKRLGSITGNNGKARKGKQR